VLTVIRSRRIAENIKPDSEQQLQHGLEKAAPLRSAAFSSQLT